MAITYAPCNFCGASLVKHQADLVNAGVEGFECPLKLESNKQERNIDAWALVTAAWEEALEEREAEEWARGVEQAFTEKEAKALVNQPGSLKDLAKRIHEAGTR